MYVKMEPPFTLGAQICLGQGQNYMQGASEPHDLLMQVLILSTRSLHPNETSLNAGTYSLTVELTFQNLTYI